MPDFKKGVKLLARDSVVIKIDGDSSGFENELKKTQKSAKAQAASLAAEYRKAGMSQSEAMKKAWSEIERESGQKSKKVKKDFDNEEDKAKKSAKNIEKSYSSAFSKVGSIAKKGLGVAVTGIAAFSGALVVGGGYAVKLASDLEEVQNVVDVTFGDNASKINTWAKEAKTAFGMSELQAKRFSGTMGAMVKSMGLSEEAVFEMSTNLTGLAGDFASFYNLEHEEAFEKIRAGISGETEPLKQLGINMSVANLEAFALSEGITKSYSEMTQAEQATLRYNYLLQAGADAQGDFARTSDSFANQLRIAKLSVDEIATSLGTVLMPVANDALGELSGYIQQLQTAFNEQGTAGLVSELGSVLSQAITKISENAPQFIDLAVKLIQSFVSGIKENLPTITEGAVEIIVSFIDGITSMLPDIIEAGLDLIISLAEGLSNNIDKITDAITECILKLIDTITDPDTIIKFQNAAFKLIGGLAKGLIEATPQLISKIPHIILSLIISFNNQIKGFVTIGKNVVEGLWNGISSSWTWLTAKIKEWCGGILDKVKAFFGIHSPSTVMSDEVGKMLVKGIAVGINKTKSELETVLDEMNEDLLDGEKEYLSEKERIEKENYEAEYQERLKNAKNSEEIEKIKQDRINEEAKNQQDVYLENLKKASENERKIYEALKKDISNIAKEKYNQYSDNIDKILDKQQDISERLYGDDDTYTKYSINAGGKTESYVKLADQSEDIKQLNSYNELLNMLTERYPDLPDEIIGYLSQMDVGEGISYIQAMLKASDEEFNKYIADIEEKQRLAEEISQKLTLNEVTELKQSFEEEFGQVPEDFFNLGDESAKKFGDGFMNQLKGIMQEIREQILDSMSALTPSIQASIAGAGGGTSNYYTNSYTFNSSKDTTTQQIFAAKNASTINKFRGES